MRREKCLCRGEFLVRQRGPPSGLSQDMGDECLVQFDAALTEGTRTLL
jgi:hypothetical protein